MKKTIQDIFIENIESDTETGITFIEGRNSIEYLSYKKLYLQACYKLYSLQEKGLKPGDELVFQFESNKNFVITFWACIFGKIIPVPVAHASAPNTIKKICGVWKKLRNPYLITDDASLRDNFQKLRNDEDVFGDILNKFLVYNDLSMSKRAKPLPSDLSDLVFIQFSSGSTGFPKGVMNIQESILYYCDYSKEQLDVQKNDRFLGWVPLTHDMGLVLFHIQPLLFNVPQFLMPPTVFLTYPELWIENMSEHQITISGSPNFGYRTVLDNLERINFTDLSLDKLKVMINSAEPVSIDDCRKFRDVFAAYGLPKNSVKPAYGLAEAVLGVSINHKEEEKNKEFLLDRSKLNIGDKVKIVKGKQGNVASFANLGTFDATEITIVNEKDAILSEGTTGYIRLKSKAITKGYYNDTETTEKYISKDGWLNTGDIGFLDNKDLVITGRAKEMILINGQNYFPNDLDSVLSEMPEINFEQAVCCSIFNESTTTDEIFVFVLYKDKIEDFKVLASNIKKYINARLALQVSKVIPVDQIPKTTSGKIQRFILKDRYLNGVYDAILKETEDTNNLVNIDSYVAPTSELECKLAKIWETALGIEQVGIDDSFFYLGGNSLKMGVLVSKIRDAFGVQVDLKKLFTAIDFKDQLRLVENAIEKPVNKIKVISENSHYPISSVQKRLFVHYQMNPLSIAYNTPVILDVNNNFDSKRCQETLNKIIDRHEILRTSFHIINKEVVQKIHRKVNFNIEHVVCKQKDFSTMLKSYIKPFKLEDPLLIRGYYFEEYNKLVIDVHHIVADGASFDILFKEYQMLYDDKELSPLKIQYKDFSQWYDNLYSEEFLQEQKGYWLQQFSDVPELLQLPYDFDINNIKNSYCDTVKIIIDTEKRDQLKELCKNERVTMFTLLISIVYSLLYRLTYQEDMVIGTSTIGRWDEDLDQSIGMFTNLLPLRNFPTGEISFSEFLKQVNSNILKCLANQEYTYDKLIDDLNILPSDKNTPLFNVMFEYHAFDWGKAISEDSHFDGFEYPAISSKFDLTIKTIEEHEKQVFLFEYNTDLFRRDSIERFASYFIRIVEEILEDKEQLLGDMEILSNTNITKLGYIVFGQNKNLVDCN